MLVTGEGPLTFDWQPLWRRAGLGEGQISRSPHSHWSGVTHARTPDRAPSTFPFPSFLPHSLASSFVFLLCLHSMFSEVSWVEVFFFLCSIWDSFVDGGGSLTLFFLGVFFLPLYFSFLHYLHFLLTPLSPSASSAPRLALPFLESILVSRSYFLRPLFLFFFSYALMGDFFSPFEAPFTFFLSTAALLDCPSSLSVTSYASLC